MGLDEDDNEEWRSWRSEPVVKFEDALRSVAEDGSWVFFYPIQVHPDYRASLWALVQEVARSLPEEQRSAWERREPEWQSQCQQPS